MKVGIPCEIKKDASRGTLLPAGVRLLVQVGHEILLQKGAALVDVCIDQGGCCETNGPATHSGPFDIVDGMVHYCVANMPGATGRISSHAFCNATLPCCREFAGLGLERFIEKSPGRSAALNMRDNTILCPAVADAFPDLIS